MACGTDISKRETQKGHGQCVCVVTLCVCGHSVVSDPHGLQPTRLLCPWDLPGKNTGLDCYFLPQGIFPTQRSNLSLLHCRQILYCLSHQGSPIPSLINHRSTFFFLEEEEIREVGREKSRSCLLSNVDREYFLCF